MADGRASSLAERAVTSAAQWVVEGRRLDMQGLAAHLGVSRVTLYRHVGSRAAVLAAALGVLTQRAWTLARSRARQEAHPGDLVTPLAIGNLNMIIQRSRGLNKLLEDEPALAIDLLTDARGPVHGHLREAIARSLREDQEQATMAPAIDADSLAFALVRLGESFLYADVLAARQPDLATAQRIQTALIVGTWARRQGAPMT